MQQLQGRVVRRVMACVLAIGVMVTMTGCGGSTPELTGVWRGDDGTGLKTVSADGSCSGMYYNNGKPLDIGGGMTCTLGEKDQDGDYILVVRQPPNQRSYHVQFEGSDTAILLEDSGDVVVTLTRQ